MFKTKFHRKYLTTYIKLFISEWYSDKNNNVDSIKYVLTGLDLLDEAPHDVAGEAIARTYG